MIKVAINGFGRIGRVAFKSIVAEHPELDVVAINDLTDIKTLAHLLKYDTVYGIYDHNVSTTKDKLTVEKNGKKEETKVFCEKDPTKLPWKKLDIDVVLECTGAFRTKEGSQKHLDAGAKRVVISAPGKGEIPSYLLGINDDEFNSKKDLICDMGSCTTNCLAPVVKVLNDEFKLVKGFMTTIHSYTTTQRILDLPHKDLRRGRAAAENIIPTTTGAAKAIGKVIPEIAGKLDGMSLRVPTPTVSIVDLVCELGKDVSVEEVNSAFKSAAKRDIFKGALAVEEEPLVSSDYKGNPYCSTVDLASTDTIGNMVKVLSWYDNEWGYGSRFADFIEFIGKKI